MIRTTRALSLRELFEQYELKRLRGKSAGTAGQFYVAIGHFAERLGHEPTTDDLSDDAVSELCWWLIRSRGIVTDTAVSYTKKLLALWRFGAKHRLVGSWPEIQLPKCPQRDPVAWTQPEIAILWRALNEQPGFIGDAPAALYWPALQLCFWDSAERLAAILMLRPDDVNLTGAWMTCRAETRKGQLRDRGYPLHQQTVDAVRALQAATGKRRIVFEAPFGEETLRQRYKGILRDAGLPHDRKRLFHCTRRTVASHFEALGHNATELLDHSSRELTVRSYISPQIVRPVRPADVLWRPGDEAKAM